MVPRTVHILWKGSVMYASIVNGKGTVAYCYQKINNGYHEQINYRKTELSDCTFIVKTTIRVTMAHDTKK